MELSVNVHNEPGGRVVFKKSLSDKYIKIGDTGTLISIQKEETTGEDRLLVEYFHPIECKNEKIIVSWDAIDWL